MLGLPAGVPTVELLGVPIVPAVPVCPTLPVVPAATDPGPVCIPGVIPVVAGVPIVPAVPAVPVVVPDVCATASDEASARATVIKRFRMRILSC